MSRDSKLVPRFYQNPFDLVSGIIQFSDGDIFVAIQSYELLFEPAHAGGAYCSFLGPKSKILTFRTFSFAVLIQHNVMLAKC